MYLHKLEKDERTTFIAFAKHLATVDDQILDAREDYMLQYMCAEMGLDAAEVESAGSTSIEQVAKVFYRPEARRVLVLEALGVALCNGVFSGSQEAELKKLAGTFQLPDDFLARAQAVIEKQMQVMEEFDALVEG